MLRADPSPAAKRRLADLSPPQCIIAPIQSYSRRPREQTMKHLFLVVLAGAVIAIPSLSYAQQTGSAEDIGQHEYFVSCANCHGDKGKGNGPFAGWLKKPSADLTKIQKENNGVFPFDRIYQVIDGRADVAAHGSRDMPIWGETYKREAIGIMGVLLTPHRVELVCAQPDPCIGGLHLHSPG